MIGHYLMNLTPAQEHRVLTERLNPLRQVHVDGSRCLTGVVRDAYLTGTDRDHAFRDKPTFLDAWPTAFRTTHTKRHPWGNVSVAHRFDALCHRFGVARVTRAIRNRVLTNQARRTLAPQLQEAV